MNNLLRISLHQLRFFGYHGWHAGEKKSGNEFEVNLDVCYQPGSGTITGIHDTIDYSILFEILKSEMQTPRHLLETLVMEMAEKIHSRFPRVEKIEISISKLTAPIESFLGNVKVSYTREY